jgi:ribose 5-phosphate isomerase A
MTSRLDDLKRQAAEAAVEYVRDGQIVGLGTGSTAKHMVAALGERVRKGLSIKGVPTSRETADLAAAAGIPLLELDGAWQIDVAIDGADQADPQLNLIKGGGGALLREKIVAAASRRLIIVVDESKLVPVLGRTFPLPIEVAIFGWRSTSQQIEQAAGAGAKAHRRVKNGEPFRTEAGNYILDLHIDRITEPSVLEARLNLIPGVVETGLFVDRTDLLIVGTSGGVETKEAPRRSDR